MLVVRDSMKANHFGAIEDQDKEVTNQIKLRNEFGNPWDFVIMC